MKNFIIAFCVFLVWSFFGLWLYYWLQEDSNKLQSKNIERVSKEIPVLDSLSISEEIPKKTELDTAENQVADGAPQALKAYTLDGDILFRYEQGISIIKNLAEVSVSSASQDFKYKLNTYFVEHPNSELHIISKYSAEENTTTPNIGIQRGNTIKAMLVETGIPATHIVVKPHITPIDFNFDETYNFAISFLFQPLNRKRLEAVKNEIPETKTIYPRFSDSGVQQSPELKQLLEEVKLVMNNNPNVAIEVIGHTDNVGNAIDNYQRGLEFARQVRWYLVAKGPLNKDRIAALSKGEGEPITSNDSERGRNLNQRIEIKFIN